MNPITKMLMPWAMLVFMITIFISGLIGLYIGYSMAENRFQEQRLHMITAQNKALDEKDTRLQEAAKRNQQLEGQFLASIDTLNQNYKALSGQMAEELRNDIYQTCIIPATGKDLLHKRVAEANKRK
ncbi:hypothetical protein GTB64_004498 [Salmonella enterica]|nr:hypothetical protein [Salmonella enterica]